MCHFDVTACAKARRLDKRSGTKLSDVFWKFHLSSPSMLKHSNGALGLGTKWDTLAVASI